MCLAVAGPVLSARGEGVTRVGIVDLGGRPREVNLALVPGVEVGTWVIVHAGHAIEALSDEQAAELVGLTDEIAGLL
ncbi:MAG: HypC/HybG/HupF family hydrogenase formation chaperone [Actinobacteria bacterium]|jgi:hydrogenase expression/formation protein HypC|nr:HypC/HybG/HupF family hydrogenase formation chaperone [Actinomycetota bacterium]MBU1493449.1 HypC/HybG/HupF family hydrogenase formation chaperone [Actinomycetota bacterium]MBU1865078.1 HypC/HybG/HupF family hydrogenase formation chaperone [Actinomycetota bacterium]